MSAHWSREQLAIYNDKKDQEASKGKNRVLDTDGQETGDRAPDQAKSALNAKKPSKYRNRKVFSDTHGKFDSKKEYVRYLELLQMQDEQKISGLVRQVPFELKVNEEKTCSYIADYMYIVEDSAFGGRRVVEDVKSEQTRKLPVYRIKKKLMQAVFKIDIHEV